MVMRGIPRPFPSPAARLAVIRGIWGKEIIVQKLGAKN